MINDLVTNFNDGRKEGTSKQFERNSFSVDETWSKEKKRIMLDAYDQLAKTTNQNEEETNETKNYNLNRITQGPAN